MKEQGRRNATGIKPWSNIKPVAFLFRLTLFDKIINSLFEDCFNKI